MTEPTTAAGRALYAKLRRGVVFLVARKADGSEFPDYALPDILAIEAEARQQDDSALRLARFVLDHWLTEYLSALKTNSVYGIGTHPLALVAAAMDGETDPAKLGLPSDLHEAFRDLLAALPPSAPPALDDLTGEHRKCGPKYEGCYAHWPMDHCRADGMAWPCDVEHIRARLQEQDR